MRIETISQTALEKPPGQQHSRVVKKRGWRQQHRIAYLLVAPATLLFLTFIVYGIAYNLYNSFLGQTFYGTTTFVGWHHFAALLQDLIFWSALRNNGVWFVLCVGVQTLLGIILALFLDLKLLGARFIKTVIFAPVVLSPVVIGLGSSLLSGSLKVEILKLDLATKRSMA